MGTEPLSKVRRDMRTRQLIEAQSAHRALRNQLARIRYRAAVRANAKREGA